MTGSLVSSLYVSLPLVTVQALIPAQVPVYAMADRLFKFGSLALAPVQQFLQGWVPEDGPQHIPARCVRAVVIGLAIRLRGRVADRRRSVRWRPTCSAVAPCWCRSA